MGFLLNIILSLVLILYVVDGFIIPLSNMRSNKQLNHGSTLNMVAGSGDRDEMKEFMNECITRGDYPTAFKYYHSHPNMKLDKNQWINLLNNIDEMIPLGYSLDKFYANLKKDGVLKSFGVMDGNYPVIDANVKEFEIIFMQNPNALLDATELPAEAFKWMPQIGKTKDAYVDIKMIEKIIISFTMAGIAGIGKLAGLDDLQAGGTAAAIVSAIAAIERNPEYQKLFTFQLEKIATDIRKFVSPHDAEHEYRRQAAIFLNAYLVGAPIVSCSMDPRAKSASKRVYFYDDAPKIDVRDKAEGIITNAPYADAQGLDMDGLCRLAVTAMAPSAIDAIHGKEVKISKFVRMLFALIFQKVGDSSVCDIRPEQLPQRLLPTLALYGLTQATLMLKESEAALDVATAAIARGAGTGEIVELIEKALQSPHPASSRQAMKEEIEQAKLKAKLAPSKLLNAVMRARKCVKELKDEAEEEIELIPGTSRIYTKEELVLPPEPNEWEIREVAKKVMNDRYHVDLRKYGRVSASTRQEVAELSKRVTLALIKYKQMEAIKNEAKKIHATTEELNERKQSHIDAQSKRAALATRNLKASVGLGEDTAEWISEGKGFIPAYAFADLVAEYADIVDKYEKVAVTANLFYQHKFLPKYNELIGKNVADAIDQAWSSSTQENMGNAASKPRSKNVSHRDQLQLLSKLKELDRIINEQNMQQFVGSVPVPDGRSYWDTVDTANKPLELPQVLSPSDLLDNHKGIERKALSEEKANKKERLALVEARLEAIVAENQKE